LKIDYDDPKHRYHLNGVEVPSVTKVLETLPKPALTWWGYRVGMAGIIRAFAENRLSLALLQSWEWEPVIKPALYLDHPDIELNPRTKKPRSAIEALLGEIRHHPNAIKDDKATIGTSIHKAAEDLGITGQVPDVDEFPEDDRGYLQALARFWIAMDPEVVHQEVIVASWTHQYAGRFDLEARTKAHGYARYDFKTSGGIYSEYDVQMSGYDLASTEMGREPVEGNYLVWLQPTGDFEVVPTTTSHADFLVELVAMRQRADRDRRVKALGRKP
jgi:hypothetical protein